MSELVEYPQFFASVRNFRSLTTGTWLRYDSPNVCCTVSLTETGCSVSVKEALLPQLVLQAGALRITEADFLAAYEQARTLLLEKASEPPGHFTEFLHLAGSHRWFYRNDGTTVQLRICLWQRLVGEPGVEFIFEDFGRYYTGMGVEHLRDPRRVAGTYQQFRKARSEAQKLLEHYATSRDKDVLADPPRAYFNLDYPTHVRQFEAWVYYRAEIWIESAAGQKCNQNSRGETWRRDEDDDIWTTFQENWPDDFDNDELVSDYATAEILAQAQIKQALNDVLDRFPWMEVTAGGEEEE